MDSVLEPANNSPKNVKQRWKNAHQAAFEFDGKPHTENDWVRILKPFQIIIEKTPEVINFVRCGNKADSSKEVLQSECDAFYNLNKAKAEAP